jgi:hypothetical protein
LSLLTLACSVSRFIDRDTHFPELFKHFEAMQRTHPDRLESLKFITAARVSTHLHKRSTPPPSICIFRLCVNLFFFVTAMPPLSYSPSRHLVMAVSAGAHYIFLPRRH